MYKRQWLPAAVDRLRADWAAHPDDHPLKQIYEKRLNTINRYVKRGTLDADLAEVMKKLAKDKMLRALSNVAYAKGDYEKDQQFSRM